MGAIEVRHTHGCDDDKLMDLWETVNDRWCEVLAVDVVECMQRNLPIPIATHMQNLCPVCEERSRERATSTKARLLETRDRAEAVKRMTAELNSALEVESMERQHAERQRLIQLGGQHILDFGKYRGVSLEALLTEDPAYVAWVAKGGGELYTVPSPLVLAARRIIQGHCRICGSAIDGPNWKTLCKECWSLRQ